MKKENTKKGLSLAKTLIFMLIVFTLVILYVVLAYPKLTVKIAEIEAQQLVTQTQIGLLEPYEQKLSELAAKEKEYAEQYEADATLTLPVEFSDLIYSAAGSSGFSVRTLKISEAGPLVTTQDYEGAQYTANLTLDMLEGFSAPLFIAALEGDGGAGIYVSALEYIYPTETASGIVTAEINMYTIAK